MPNSEVKRRSADGSVGSPHARVGHCQASIKPRGHPQGWPFCYVRYINICCYFAQFSRQSSMRITKITLYSSPAICFNC
jgi:hypothetical protein